MNATQLMTPNVFTVNQNQACDAAAKIMWDNDVGSAPVVDDDRRVVGIVTDRDICMGAFTKGQRLADIPVRSVMAKNVISAKETDTLRIVEDLMRTNQIRRVPVIDADGRITGIIAFADLARRRGKKRPDEAVSEREIASTIEAVSQPHAV